MCGQTGNKQMSHQGKCCCSGHNNRHHTGFRRNFLSKDEKKAQLEKYLNDLQAEMKAVEEILKGMREGA